MKIKFLRSLLPVVTCFLLMETCFVSAQPATDMPCQSAVFYGNAGSAVHRLQFNGTSVTDLGVLTTPSQNMFGLAYGMDITRGSAHRTLYGSAVNAGFNQSDIIRYDGSSWTSIVTDSLVYHNAAAYGPFIYFMHSATADQPNNQCIARLNANGTLTKIFTDTSLVFSVADMAVDSAGNIYCFRGPSIGVTTQLTVLNQVGNVIQTYSTNLNNLNTFYGAMFLNGTLYLGWNTVNGQIIPVGFGGTTASLGTGIPMPSGFSLRDLANCHDSAEVVSDVPEVLDVPSVTVFPNPSIDGRITIVISGNCFGFALTNVSGSVLYASDKGEEIQTIHLKVPGIYFLKVKVKDRWLMKKVVVSG